MSYLFGIIFIAISFSTFQSCFNKKLTTEFQKQEEILKFDFRSDSRDTIYIKADTLYLKIQSNIATGHTWTLCNGDENRNVVKYDKYEIFQKEISGNYIEGFDNFIISTKKLIILTFCNIQPWEPNYNKAFKKHVSIIPSE